jgi:hypothetical protein
MQWRIFSPMLFLLGMFVMGLSNFTTFFHVTRVDYWTATGMGAFGFILCCISGFLMLPSDEGEAGAPVERRIYSATLFGAGLFHMSLAILTLFFHFTSLETAPAVNAAIGGLVLCIAGTVMLHATFQTRSSVDDQQIKGKLLLMQGAADPYVHWRQLEALSNELEKAGIDYEMIVFGHTEHAFTNPASGNDPKKGSAYNARADARSWEAMTAPRHLSALRPVPRP